MLWAAAVPFDAVMAQMDAGENHFAIAGVDEPADFVENVLDRPAGKMRPHFGDDAEAATQQAAVLHFDVGPLAIGEGADAGGQVDHAEAAQQIGQFALVGDDFGDAGQRGDFLRGPRGVAAHHDDSRAGISGRQLANGLPAFGIAFVRDRASVDDAQIGALAARRHPDSRCR